MIGGARIAGGQGGIGLLEAIVGVTILGIAASLLIVNSRTSVTGQERSKVYSQAAAATREAMEHLDRLPIDSLDRLQGAGIPHSQGTGIRVLASVRRVMASDVDGIAELDTSTLRHVTLRTAFRSRGGDEVQKTFSTILYRP